MVLFSIALCTVAMFVPIDINALLVRSEESYFGTPEALRERADFRAIEDWLNEPESLAENSTFKQVVAATASLTGLKEKRIGGVVKCLNRAITKKRLNRFEWCTCEDLLPVYRYLTILLQVNTILERFPPRTNHELVHTTFAEEGLLQVYCLIYILVHYGYQEIHVNVIGDHIIDRIHCITTTNQTGFFPEIISPDEIAKIEKVIKRKFQKVGLKYSVTVTVDIYKSAYDYIEAVETTGAKRSHSFDNIDSDKLDSKVYTVTKTKAKLQKSVCEGLAITNYHDLRQIGRIEDCSRVEIYSYDMGYTNKNKRVNSDLIRSVTIIPDGSSESLQCRKARKKVLRLMCNATELDQRYIEKHKQHIYFLLVGRDDPSSIFTELVNRTRVKEVCPVVFEARFNQIYEYEEG